MDANNPKPKFLLEVIDGPWKGKQFELNTAREERIGRSVQQQPPNTIVLPDPTVSRVHFTLKFTDGKWQFTNLALANPIYLDGVVCQSGTLTQNSILRVAVYTFKLIEAKDEPKVRSRLDTAENVSLLLPPDCGIQKIRRISGGAFGEVWMGKYCGETVALKMIKQDTPTAVNTSAKLSALQKEAAMLMKVRHPHIVRFYGVWPEKKEGERDEFWIVTEFVNGGDLLTLLRREWLPIRRKLKMAIDIAQGMSFLERLKIVHRDLAARNVLVDRQGDDIACKITDFGLAEISQATIQSEHGLLFPVRWAAPEGLSNSAFGTKSDVWAFGVVMWEIFTNGLVPYFELRDQDVAKHVKLGLRLPKPQLVPDAVYELMQRCWQADPKARPTFQAVGDVLMAEQEIVSRLEEILQMPEFKCSPPKPDEIIEGYDCVREDGYLDVTSDSAGVKEVKKEAKDEIPSSAGYVAPVSGEYQEAALLSKEAEYSAPRTDNAGYL